ncbi:hypothetical protein [Geomesophilobacter sediminis]|nr:hypothetical protein [Geomesophilobacter sediminis]
MEEIVKTAGTAVSIITLAISFARLLRNVRSTPRRVIRDEKSQIS